MNPAKQTLIVCYNVLVWKVPTPETCEVFFLGFPLSLRIFLALGTRPTGLVGGDKAVDDWKWIMLNDSCGPGGLVTTVQSWLSSCPRGGTGGDEGWAMEVDASLRSM